MERFVVRAIVIPITSTPNLFVSIFPATEDSPPEGLVVTKHTIKALRRTNYVNLGKEGA